MPSGIKIVEIIPLTPSRDTAIRVSMILALNGASLKILMPFP